MSKKTQIDKALESLDAKIAVLQLAKAELQQQQKTAPVRRPRAVAQTKVEKATA